MSGAHDDLAADLALMRSSTHTWVRDAAKRVEAEIARLREESEENFSALMDERDKAVAAEARCARLQQALACDHHETAWTFVEYEGATWNRCADCGLMERWAGGTRFDQRVVPDEALVGLDTPADKPADSQPAERLVPCPCGCGVVSLVPADSQPEGPA